jgi:hypothetical protein
MGVDSLSAETMEALKESCWNGFKIDDQGLYLEGRQVKACLKESANIVKGMLNITALKQRLAERVYVVEETIPLSVKQPSGSYEAMIHAMTAMGPINALKRVDYVERPVIRFTLRVLNEPLMNKDKKKLPPMDYLTTILAHAGENGLGADRSQGNGQFDVIKLELIPEAHGISADLSTA